jgi:carbon-monoxide dehydrogenase large subunit
VIGQRVRRREDPRFITGNGFPMFERVQIETPTPINPLGATGIGESGTIGSTPAALDAVIDAVIDAVSHLGVRHIDMPANGERVWRAIQDARA